MDEEQKSNRVLNVAWTTDRVNEDWVVYTIKGDPVAVEIPHSAVADHIVEMHNAYIKAKREEEACDNCGHFKYRHGSEGCVVKHIGVGNGKCECPRSY